MWKRCRELDWSEPQLFDRNTTNRSLSLEWELWLLICQSKWKIFSLSSVEQPYRNTVVIPWVQQMAILNGSDWMNAFRNAQLNGNSPSNAAIATKYTAKLYFWCHQAANAALQKYIANELGRKAVLAINIPGLNNWKINHNRPICIPNSRQTALQWFFNHSTSHCHPKWLTCRNKLRPMHSSIRAYIGSCRTRALDSVWIDCCRTMQVHHVQVDMCMNVAQIPDYIPMSVVHVRRSNSVMDPNSWTFHRNHSHEPIWLHKSAHSRMPWTPYRHQESLCLLSMPILGLCVMGKCERKVCFDWMIWVVNELVLHCPRCAVLFRAFPQYPQLSIVGFIEWPRSRCRSHLWKMDWQSVLKSIPPFQSPTHTSFHLNLQCTVTVIGTIDCHVNSEEE